MRQAAVYGAGAIAQFGGDAVNALMPEVVARLRAVIDSPESRRKPYLVPGENAVSALGKVAQYQGHPAINPAEVGVCVCVVCMSCVCVSCVVCRVSCVRVVCVSCV